ncbi:hypothetical protein CPter91_5485 [Collimonas pratensis]|uniref:Uncharacterized protein n=1 Tax=Collimonas pratensis TaxID=279113 RepID=A0A127QCJ2_9BURK|nr:hypothetical protein CPter91_5485 [Collimonas pratensis]
MFIFFLSISTFHVDFFSAFSQFQFLKKESFREKLSFLLCFLVCFLKATSKEKNFLVLYLKIYI